MGRHFRVIIGKDGTTVQSVTALSKAPSELSTYEKGKKVDSLVTTQESTEYPLETHVFASMLAGVPIYVRTTRGVWLVDREKIHLLANDP
jgi:hypothetical protein